MKPFSSTAEDYGDTGCCPGHDDPRIRKWSGSYRSKNSKRASAKITKKNNRLRRRRDKLKIKKESE